MLACIPRRGMPEQPTYQPEHSCANGAVPDWLYVAVPYELALLEVDSREVAIARWTVLHY